ncbi:hypothetical protein GGX14DRAFT_409272 [Mycena pura]|uniref:Uncharacterized protein n=1 Tax=Mycena pura TaxID=153505 RepID=A0AAD6UMJ0_9AGAR|nr:hypothetical protein GGX14DRAFT_409272 [Mycena pura]
MAWNDIKSNEFITTGSRQAPAFGLSQPGQAELCWGPETAFGPAWYSSKPRPSRKPRLLLGWTPTTLEPLGYTGVDGAPARRMLAVPVIVIAAAASAKDNSSTHVSGIQQRAYKYKGGKPSDAASKGPFIPKATFPPASPSWWRDLNFPSGLDKKRERKCSGCGGSFGTLALPSWHYSALINMLQQHNGHTFRPHPKHTMSPVCNDNTRALDLGPPNCEVGIDYFADFTPSYMPPLALVD